MSDPAAESLPLRALLARIWRDYLSQHKAALGLSILCAAATGLLRAAVLALLGGLILNLMPCVFPILAMKAAALSATCRIAATIP